MMNGIDGHGWGMGWWWIIGLFIVVAVVWMVLKSINTNRRTNLPSGKSTLKH
jgi:putative membrane protein